MSHYVKINITIDPSLIPSNYLQTLAIKKDAMGLFFLSRKREFFIFFAIIEHNNSPHIVRMVPMYNFTHHTISKNTSHLSLATHHPSLPGPDVADGQRRSRDLFVASGQLGEGVAQLGEERHLRPQATRPDRTVP